MNIGMHTASVVHVIELRSSWTIVDGFAVPARSPHVFERPMRVAPVRAKISKAQRGMDEARAEIARRIKERGKR